MRDLITRKDDSFGEMPRTPAQIAIGDFSPKDFSPKLVELADQVLFGDIWERPGQSKRDRSLIPVASLIAPCRTEQLPGHRGRALENGVKREE
jgi:4-carboxymuconolactone decarboxylase